MVPMWIQLETFYKARIKREVSTKVSMSPGVVLWRSVQPSGGR